MSRWRYYPPCGESWKTSTGTGPWWIRERDYRRIISAYEAERGKHGEDALSLGFLGRAAVAVQHSWSKVDVVVKAQVVEDINVFAGRGQRQYREWLRANIYITLSGWPQIEQLFIPNLGDQNGLTELGRRALLVLRKKTITSTWF